MRWAVLADIHGNLTALQAVLADVQEHKVDGIIAAGDMVGSGPQPLEVIQLLRSHGVLAVRGNNENYVLEYDAGKAPARWTTSKQWSMVRCDARKLHGDALEWIASLPEERTLTSHGIPSIRVVHGRPGHIASGLYPDRDLNALRAFEAAGFPLSRQAVKLEDVLARLDEAVLVCGHTHIPWQQAENGKLALNPGPVCRSLIGHTVSHYALLTWAGAQWKVEHHAVTYDLDELRAAYDSTGTLEEGGAFARAFLRCSETGRNVPWFFVDYAYRLKEQAGSSDGDIIPDDIWDRADASFDWETGGQVTL